MSGAETVYPRHIEQRIIEALTDTPAVMIAGPRQAGKTTLVRRLAASHGMRYLTLDDEMTLLAAVKDPVGMIRALDRAVIDEIQRAPHLLLSIKKTIDEDRRPGRFLFTGSANIMTLPTVADSLAGRMETLYLLPLSQSEMRGGSANWLDSAFDGRLPEADVPLIGSDLVEAVVRGGYPESVARPTPRRRMAWSRQYIDALIQRDVRDLAGVDRLDLLPRFLRALAQVSGQLCNYSLLGSQLHLDHKTSARYIGLFEQMFLLDFSPAKPGQDRSRFGNLLETFIYGELRKHAASADGDYRLLYYRDHDKYEVDLVVEDAGGRLIGVEVTAAATIRESDLRGLKRLATVAGDRFMRGVVLYDGTETVPLGERLCAAPISSLWGNEYL